MSSQNAKNSNDIIYHTIFGPVIIIKLFSSEAYCKNGQHILSEPKVYMVAADNGEYYI